MKGLREYVKKHGMHFTEKLALDAIPLRWDAEKVKQATQKKVYYNVTGASSGDMLYLVGIANKKTLDKCIDFMINVISDYGFSDGLVFSAWYCLREACKDNVDLTEYI